MDNSVPDFSRFSNNDMLRFCNVKFSEDGPQYTYYCGDSDIAVGDEVIVPVWGDSIKTAIVSRIIVRRKCKAPFPLDKIKQIIGKTEPPAERSNEKPDEDYVEKNIYNVYIEDDNEKDVDSEFDDELEIDEFDEDEDDDTEDSHGDDFKGSDWHPGARGTGISSIDSIFDLDGDGELDDLESMLEIDDLFDDDD